MRNSTLSRRSMAFRVLVTAILFCVSATASATKLVNLLVENDGLHRVTYEQLANSGVDLEGVRHAKLSLTKGGQLISVFSKGQTSEDRSQRKYFGCFIVF